VGNINNATLAEGPPERIRKEVTRCLEIGREVPGFVANVGGGLTHQIPIDHLDFFINLRRNLCN
jgi:uroporphyrinogen-III decarboxylase